MHSLVIATMMKIEKVAINDALPLKAVRRDAIAKLKFFWGFESELQTDLMPFHLYSLGRSVNTACSVCDGLGTEQNTEGG